MSIILINKFKHVLNTILLFIMTIAIEEFCLMAIKGPDAGSILIIFLNICFIFK